MVQPSTTIFTNPYLPTPRKTHHPHPPNHTGTPFHTKPHPVTPNHILTHQTTYLQLIYLYLAPSTVSHYTTLERRYQMSVSCIQNKHGFVRQDFCISSLNEAFLCFYIIRRYDDSIVNSNVNKPNVVATQKRLKQKSCHCSL